MATLNIVFDESGKRDRSHIVYAGFVIDTGPAWDELSRRWRVLLYRNGLTSCHANEAFTFGGKWKKFRGRSDERDKLLLALAGMAQDFPREATGTMLSTAEFNALSASERARYHDDPFYCAFERGILSAVANSGELPEDNFNLLCDDSEESAAKCLEVYRQFTKSHPDLASRIGTICFGDDEKLPPLQMADMFAYCLRRRAEGQPEDQIWKPVLDVFLTPAEGHFAEWRPLILRPESRGSVLWRRARQIADLTRRFFSR